MFERSELLIQKLLDGDLPRQRDVPPSRSNAEEHLRRVRSHLPSKKTHTDESITIAEIAFETNKRFGGMIRVDETVMVNGKDGVMIGRVMRENERKYEK